MNNSTSIVESFFKQKMAEQNLKMLPIKTESITVPNYIVLGQITALRFIEWISDNPNGVISLPTGKTPEYFIKWFNYFKDNWTKEIAGGISAEIGFPFTKFPTTKGLHFVQIDEFFPMNPNHPRSFRSYVEKYYIDGFGLDRSNALLFDTFNFPDGLSIEGYNNVYTLFSGKHVDFSLRFRNAQTLIESLQQKVLRSFDQLCQDFEQKIRLLGGIGFFLGGIGPDGHIGFNVRGSSHFSPTRLTTLNYESMASAAGDLGGIESVRSKGVITIGLETITFNTNATAIIFAAGNSKSAVIQQSLTNNPSTMYPATVLQSLPGARFYLTPGAASRVVNGSSERSQLQAIINAAIEKKEKIQEHSDYWNDINKKATWSQKPLSDAIKTSILNKISNGINVPDNQRILHTGPHHDDIELGYFPLIHHLVRSSKNINTFAYLTSGFTSVTNNFTYKRLESLCMFINNGALFRQCTFKELSDNRSNSLEIHGYLNAIATQDTELQELFCAARIVRNMTTNWELSSIDMIVHKTKLLLATINQLEPGDYDSEELQMVKSWIREWEAETVWAHFGLPTQAVFHMRLRFYTGAIFPNHPEFQRDMLPLVDLLEKVDPTIVTLAFDPESSGPDTHYKCLIAMRAALAAFTRKSKKRPPDIWGYRNVWSRFEISEVNSIVPLSLNSFAVLHKMFTTCFVSQKSASFPSYELDGTFSDLAQKVWVEQFNDLSTLLGKNTFYESSYPMMRRAYGALYLKKMTFDEFMEQTSELENLELARKPLI